MKSRKNNIGIGIISVALALAIPLNANADEINLTPLDDTVEPKKQVFIEDSEISEEVTNPTPNSNSSSTPTPTTTRVRTNKPNLKINTNYISRQGQLPEAEEKIEINPQPVSLRVNDQNGEKKSHLVYSFDILGDKAVKEYTISVFALKDSQIKILEGEDLSKDPERILNDDIRGFKLKTKITGTRTIRAKVDLDESPDLGTYTIYYIVTSDGKSTVGKIDANLIKDDKGRLTILKEKPTEEKPSEEKPSEEKLIEENQIIEKANPFGKLPFKTYILNNTDQDKNLTDYIDLGTNDLSDYKLTLSFINPTTDEAKKKEITKPEDFVIPARSMARFDLRAKNVKPLISEEEIIINDKEKTLGKKTENSLMNFLGLPEEKPNQKPTDNLENKLVQVKNDLYRLLKEKKKSVVELDDLTIEKARTLTQAIREKNRQIQELIQQVLLDSELDSLTKLEEENPELAKEEYKRIADLVKEAEIVSDKASNKLIELDEIIYTDNSIDPLLARNSGGKPVLNLGKLTPLTTISDLTKDSPTPSERDFSTKLRAKLALAVKKIETVTISEKDNQKAYEKPINVKEDKETKNEIETSKNQAEKPEAKENPSQDLNKPKANEKAKAEDIQPSKEEKLKKPMAPADKNETDKNTKAEEKPIPLKNTKAEELPKANPKAKEVKPGKSLIRKTKTEPKVNTPIFVRYLQTLNIRSRLIDNE